MKSSSDDACLRIAGRLTDALHLSRESHVLFQENIATYVAQLTDDFVKGLESKPDAELAPALCRALPYGETRWGIKLRRDVGHPYSDADVAAHLRGLGAELSGKVERLTALNGGEFPFKLYVIGSLVRGRFGGNSDLDVLLNSGNERARGLGCEPGEEVSMRYFSGEESFDELTDELFGTKVELDPREIRSNPAILEQLETSALEKKGYQADSNGWKAARHVVRQKETELT